MGIFKKVRIVSIYWHHTFLLPFIMLPLMYLEIMLQRSFPILLLFNHKGLRNIWWILLCKSNFSLVLRLHGKVLLMLRLKGSPCEQSTAVPHVRAEWLQLLQQRPAAARAGLWAWKRFSPRIFLQVGTHVEQCLKSALCSTKLCLLCLMDFTWEIAVFQERVTGLCSWKGTLSYSWLVILYKNNVLYY